MKLVLTEINFDLIISFDYLELNYVIKTLLYLNNEFFKLKKKNIKPVILLKISKNDVNSYKIINFIN